MKIISILRGLSTGAALGRAEEATDREAHWLRDPLAHPDLEAMSQRELADLSFGFRRNDQGRACPA